MKAPFYLLLTFSALAHSEPSVKLVEVISQAKLPDSIPFEVKPNGNSPSRLSFLIEGENLVAVAKESLKIEDNAAKWEIGFFNSVSDDGKYASLQLSSDQVFLGKMDAVKVKGTIDLLTGSNKESSTLTLKANADPTEAGPLKVRFKKAKKGKKGFFGSGSGIEVKGDYNAINEILFVVAGKEVKASGWSSMMNGPRVYSLDQEVEGDEIEVKITYWTDLAKTTVTFEK